MKIMTEAEKAKMKIRLLETISDFIERETENDHKLGFLPENIETLMADSAFSVLMAVTQTNEYIDKNITGL